MSEPTFHTAIHWFRRDLRISDNLALRHASESAKHVVPVYILSDWTGQHAWTGPKRQHFLRGCLESLARNLETVEGALLIRQGDACAELKKLIQETKADALFFNRDPDPFGRAMESRVAEMCQSLGVEVHAHKDVVLHEPDEVLTGDGNPYRVYTPYSKAWFDRAKPEPVPKAKPLRTPPKLKGLKLPTCATWKLETPDGEILEAGEKAARQRLKKALSGPLLRYEGHRDFPFEDGTSRLGPDLRFGTISVREVFHGARQAAKGAETSSQEKSLFTFQKQLAWREFFMAILGHFPHVLDAPFNPAYEDVPWDEPGDAFEKWKNGETGYPIVDAGMRQLNATGYMHNRVRMIVAMFLTKDLHIHWKEGERYFMQQLVDGEIANNNGGWQWSAGTGADAAPYFRIQNPWTQTKRFDPDGKYIKAWVPELKDVEPARFQAPPEAGKRLAKDYPPPMVDHKQEREETLGRFKQYKKP